MQLFKRKPKLSLHIITMDRADKLERVLSVCAGHFDVIRVCDGGSVDDTLGVCKKYGCAVTVNEWKDDMSEQHNVLLENAKPGDKIFILDDDEYPTKELLARLPTLLNDEHNLTKVPSIMELNDVMQYEDIDAFITAQASGEIDQFSKEIFFVYDEGVYYEGDSHYGLVDSGWNKTQIAEPIIHFKTSEEQIWCDLYQGFINPIMQGYEPTDAQTMKEAFRKAGVHTTQQLSLYLEGDISDNLKELFVLWKHPHYGSKSRLFQWYYLIKHPELLPQVHDSNPSDTIIRHVRDMDAMVSRSIWEDGQEYLLTKNISPLLQVYFGGRIALPTPPKIVFTTPTLMSDDYWVIFNRNMREGVHRTSGDTRKNNVSYVLKWLCENDEFRHSGLLLNVGIGDSQEMIYFRDAGLKCIGISNSQDEADYAKELALEAHRMDMHQLQFPANFFDYIYMHDTLEHSIAPVMAFTHFRRVLKENGLLIVHYPPYNEIYDWTHWFIVTAETMKWWFRKFGFDLIGFEDFGSEATSQYLFIGKKTGIAKEDYEKGANVVDDMLREIEGDNN